MDAPPDAPKVLNLSLLSQASSKRDTEHVLIEALEDTGLSFFVFLADFRWFYSDFRWFDGQKVVCYFSG